MSEYQPSLFDNEDELLPFNGVRVYLSGIFTRSIQDISFKLTKAGAITKMGLAKATYVIIAANNQSSDDLAKIATLKNDGFNIPIISESEMYAILSGELQVKFEEPIKDIDITYDFIFSKQFPKIIEVDNTLNLHPLGQKEIYMYGETKETPILCQALGNIGAYVTKVFDPKTVDYCWLESNTIELLKKGVKDDFIKNISAIYNNSESDKFTYKFLLATDVIGWMRKRAYRIGDEISSSLLEKYRNSFNE